MKYVLLDIITPHGTVQICMVNLLQAGCTFTQLQLVIIAL
jgi:hypothetical protein